MKLVGKYIDRELKGSVVFNYFELNLFKII